MLFRSIGSDPRIGYQFIYPGCGYGGSCFPKDVRALIHSARHHHCDLSVLSAVESANEAQKHRIFELIMKHYGNDISSKVFAVWGLAFKPNTDDIREAPSMSLMANALAAKAAVRAFDPVAAPRLNEQMPEVTTVGDMYEVLAGCDALVICTEWNEFRQPDFGRIGAAMKGKVIFDGRNIFRTKLMAGLGFTYYSVGREPVTQGSGTDRPAGRSSGIGQS